MQFHSLKQEPFLLIKRSGDEEICIDFGCNPYRGLFHVSIWPNAPGIAGLERERERKREMNGKITMVRAKGT